MQFQPENLLNKRCQRYFLYYYILSVSLKFNNSPPNCVFKRISRKLCKTCKFEFFDCLCFTALCSWLFSEGYHDVNSVTAALIGCPPPLVNVMKGPKGKKEKKRRESSTFTALRAKNPGQLIDFFQSWAYLENGKSEV